MSNPRPLTQRERNLIELYSYCQVGMTPKQFYAKWEVDYEIIANICVSAAARSASLNFYCSVLVPKRS
ncbi:MAG: hypothetical protein ICV85_18400 [Tolypothrix sp. T3-bin4]|nr:hypothetical protein [Tolypothrix sp. T3-bin4]